MTSNKIKEIIKDITDGGGVYRVFSILNDDVQQKFYVLVYDAKVKSFHSISFLVPSGTRNVQEVELKSDLTKAALMYRVNTLADNKLSDKLDRNLLRSVISAV